MMEGWKEVRLGDVTTKIGSGVTPRGGSSVYISNGTSLIRSQNVYNGYFDYGGLVFIDEMTAKKMRNVELFENDILINITGDSVARCSIVPKKCLPGRVNQHVAIIRCNEKVNANFVKYSLISPHYQARLLSIATGAGATRNSLTKATLEDFKINLPSIHTQYKIASILSAYDDLIENNLKRIKLLEEMAQQTYEEWFVRILYPGFKDAVINEETGLPKGWGMMKLADICEKITDGTHDSPKIKESGYKLITGKHLHQGAIDFETAYFISEEDHFKIKNRSGLIKNDILFSNIGTLGNVAMVTQNFEFSCKNMLIFRPLVSHEYFLYTYLLNENNRQKLVGQSAGSTQKFLSLGFIRNFEDFMPPVDLIRQFNQGVIFVYQNITNLQTQNQRLKEARDILLPRLMSGMIEVENLESKPSDAKTVPLEQSKKEASKEFKEAVLIACLTERFGSEKFPLGRKRYTKLSYLFHRYADNKIQDYLRKAAGPYNPKTKYGGPEKIGLQNKYIQNWRSENGMTGFVTAEKIEGAKGYFSNYWQVAELDWLATEFKYKSNDELELLATVDNSLMELSKKNLEFTADNVLKVIKSEKEWEAKLERTIFSETNVERAIGFLRNVLEYRNVRE